MENVMKNLNSQERAACEELQLRLKNTLTTKLCDDPTVFYRFLKARDFDVNKAEVMLRKHIAFRKAFQLDTILNTFKPKEVFNYLSSSVVGFNSDGNLVRYSPPGKLDIGDLTSIFKRSDYIKHWIWITEGDVQRLKQENSRTGKDAFQEILIVDLDGCPFSNITNKASPDILLRGSSIVQDNYPERLKGLYIINAPVYFSILFSMLKKVMSTDFLQKIHVFAQNGWKDVLLKVVDADLLPAFLGGNRTDPDGNPLCNTFIHHGGRVSPKHFLSDDERYFSDMTRVKKVYIPQKDSLKVPVEVKEGGSVIQWEFVTKNKDIDFGLLYQITELELEELLPMQRFITTDGTEKGSFTAASPGTYIVLFDNTHSWWTSKEVKYCLTVKCPE